MEPNGSTTGTVTRTGSTADDLVVTLASRDTTEATVPGTVIIPTGQREATFNINAVDDTIQDGTNTVTIKANAETLHLEFANDARVGPGDDRNLHVYSVDVDSEMLDIGDSANNRDNGAPLPGQHGLWWAGDLEFDLSLLS